MAFAVIKTGCKQYVAREGETLTIERLKVGSPTSAVSEVGLPLKKGGTVTFDEVLLVSDGGMLVLGAPMVEGKSVTATFEREIREPKKITYKYKPKARTRVKRGSRQIKAVVKISTVS